MQGPQIETDKKQFSGNGIKSFSFLVETDCGKNRLYFYILFLFIHDQVFIVLRNNYRVKQKELLYYRVREIYRIIVFGYLFEKVLKIFTQVNSAQRGCRLK